jgi:hypothetical protein
MLSPVAAQTFWQGNSAGYRITWTAKNLQAQHLPEPVVFDAGRYGQKSWADIVEDMDAGNYYAEFGFRLLSVVGPVLSISERDFCSCGGAHPMIGKQFVAVDLTKSKPADLARTPLTQYFPSVSIYNALIKDSVVKAVLPKGTVPGSLEALLQAVKGNHYTKGECAYEFGDSFLEQFAFYDYKDGRAIVRLSLSHASEICRGNMIQVGIELPVPEGPMKAALESARLRQQGILMKDINAMVDNDAATVVKFPLETPKH